MIFIFKYLISKLMKIYLSSQIKFIKCFTKIKKTKFVKYRVIVLNCLHYLQVYYFSYFLLRSHLSCVHILRQVKPTVRRQNIDRLA